MIKKIAVSLYALFVSIASFSQTNAIATFDLPLSNSFKFNKYLINPTFSFVREDYSALSFFNRRQWTQFENSPQVYFINYVTKVGENSSSAIGLYQQNYGVFTNFGAQLNYASNINISDDSNFTFGFNLAYYGSGFNSGKIVSNYQDPLLQSADSNSLIAFKPGLNFGTSFFDIGVSVNNLFLYNLKTGQNVVDDQGKSYAAHLMYTGYIENNDGLFEKAKFTVFGQAEKKKDVTGFSGNVMLEAPKAGWVNGGFNSIYGISGGLGILVTKNIAVGYTFEKGLGDLSRLGATHEVTFAYIFKSYTDDDFEALIKPKTKTATTASPKIDPIDKKQKDEDEIAKRKLLAEQAAERVKAAEQAKADKIKLAAEEIANKKAAADKIIADAKQKIIDDRLALEAANAKKITDLRNAAADKIKLAAEKVAADNAKAKADATAKAEKIANDAQQAKLNAEARKRELAERVQLDAANAKKVNDERIAAANEKLKTDEANRVKSAADKLAKEKAEAKIAADKLAKEKADAALSAKAKADEAARLKVESDAAAKAEAKIAADKLAKEKADAALSAKAKADEAARLKAEADAADRKSVV